VTESILSFFATFMLMGLYFDGVGDGQSIGDYGQLILSGGGLLPPSISNRPSGISSAMHEIHGRERLGF